MAALYLPIRTCVPFVLRYGGILRSINADPKDLVIDSFSHMADMKLDFRSINGFRCDLLPRLDIRLLEGAGCTLVADKPAKIVLEIELLPNQL